MAANLPYSGFRRARRCAAATLCVALLYFAAGGSFLHLHTTGQDTVCHVCQSLHAPVLAVSAANAIAAPGVIGWHDSLPIPAAALSEVSLDHAGRAPPTI